MYMYKVQREFACRAQKKGWCILNYVSFNGNGVLWMQHKNTAKIIAMNWAGIVGLGENR